MKLKEGVITILEDNVEVKKFLFYHYGCRKYYHLLNFQVIVKKWIAEQHNIKEVTAESLYYFIKKHYDKLVIMTEEDVNNLRAYRRFLKSRKQ